MPGLYVALRRFAGLLGLVLASAPGSAKALPPTAGSAPSLRICCYLGHDAETHLGPLHTPVAFANTVSIQELTTHAYADRSVLSERNGLVYTCGGGTIDVGHVRNAADWAGHLLPIARAGLGSGGVTTIHEELGSVQLRLRRRHVPEGLRERLARAIAVRASYELAVWHELATLHFPGQYPVFPEQFSAFSPEDLYSDLLGAHLGVRAATSPLPYDDAMASLLPTSLDDLGAVSASGTQRALDHMAGNLWNPDAAVPEAELLLARRVPDPMSMEPSPAWAAGYAECTRNPPVRRSVPRYVATEDVTEFYELAFHVSDAQRARLIGDSPASGPITSPELPAALRQARLSLARHEAAAPGGASDSLTPEQERARWSEWRRTPLGEYQGVRFLPLRAFGGVTVAGDTDVDDSATWSGGGGGSLVGVRADTVGGDGYILRYSALWAGSERGLVQHLTGVQTRAQFSCEHAATGAYQAPVLSWFRDCKPNGWLGVGATIFQAQHDGESGRTVLRPIELQLALNLTGNAFDLSFLHHHLVLTLGGGIDSISGQRDVAAHVAPRGVATLSGLLRSQDAHWELDGHVGVRQSMLELRDTGVEGKLTLQHRFDIHQGDGPRAPTLAHVTVGLEAGGAWWGVPERSIADEIVPLVSATQRASAYLLVPVGVSINRLTF